MGARDVEPTLLRLRPRHHGLHVRPRGHVADLARDRAPLATKLVHGRGEIRLHARGEQDPCPVACERAMPLPTPREAPVTITDHAATDVGIRAMTFRSLLPPRIGPPVVRRPRRRSSSHSEHAAFAAVVAPAAVAVRGAPRRALRKEPGRETTALSDEQFITHLEEIVASAVPRWGLSRRPRVSLITVLGSATLGAGDPDREGPVIIRF